jgi:hypothetical protein
MVESLNARLARHILYQRATSTYRKKAPALAWINVTCGGLARKEQTILLQRIHPCLDGLFGAVKHLLREGALV